MLKRIIVSGSILVAAFGMVGCGKPEEPVVEQKPVEIVEQVEDKQEEPKKVVEEKPVEIKPEEPKKVVEEKVEDERITNSDFKKLLKGNNAHDKLVKFFKENDGREMEFNGAVDALGFVPGMKTRVRMMIRLGNYDVNSCPEPSLYVDNIGLIESGINEAFKKDEIAVGVNVKCKAVIEGYNKDLDRIDIRLLAIEKR